MSDSITNDDETNPYEGRDDSKLIEDLYGGPGVMKNLRLLTALQVAYIRRARLQEHLPWDNLPSAIRAHYDEQLAIWDAYIAEAEAEEAREDVLTAEDAAALLQRPEVFENETTIFHTFEVDAAYRPIVEVMARAIFQHDHTSKLEFPTGSEEVDAPYLCRADDALREALPLLRAKLAGELHDAFDSEGE